MPNRCHRCGAEFELMIALKKHMSRTHNIFTKPEHLIQQKTRWVTETPIPVAIPSSSQATVATVEVPSSPVRVKLAKSSSAKDSLPPSSNDSVKSGSSTETLYIPNPTPTIPASPAHFFKRSGEVSTSTPKPDSKARPSFSSSIPASPEPPKPREEEESVQIIPLSPPRNSERSRKVKKMAKPTFPRKGGSLPSPSRDSSDESWMQSSGEGSQSSDDETSKRAPAAPARTVAAPARAAAPPQAPATDRVIHYPKVKPSCPQCKYDFQTEEGLQNHLWVDGKHHRCGKCEEKPRFRCYLFFSRHNNENHPKAVGSAAAGSSHTRPEGDGVVRSSDDEAETKPSVKEEKDVKPRIKTDPEESNVEMLEPVKEKKIEVKEDKKKAAAPKKAPKIPATAKPKPKAAKPRVEEELEECPICLKQIKKIILEKHKKIHDPPVEHKCMKCDRIFSSKFNLEVHIEGTHRRTDIEEFQREFANASRNDEKPKEEEEDDELPDIELSPDESNRGKKRQSSPAIAVPKKRRGRQPRIVGKDEDSSSEDEPLPKKRGRRPRKLEEADLPKKRGPKPRVSLEGRSLRERSKATRASGRAVRAAARANYREDSIEDKSPSPSPPKKVASPSLSDDDVKTAPYMCGICLSRFFDMRDLGMHIDNIHSADKSKKKVK